MGEGDVFKLSNKHIYIIDNRFETPGNNTLLVNGKLPICLGTFAPRAYALMEKTICQLTKIIN